MVKARIRIRRDNTPRDNTKLRILDFLSAKQQGATRFNIMTHANIRKQEDENFKIILDEMVSINWIEKTSFEHGGGMTVYTLKDEGRSALEKAKELKRDNHPISKLSAFNEID